MQNIDTMLAEQEEAHTEDSALNL